MCFRFCKSQATISRAVLFLKSYVECYQNHRPEFADPFVDNHYYYHDHRVRRCDTSLVSPC